MRVPYEKRISFSGYYREIQLAVENILRISKLESVIDVGCADCLEILKFNIPHKTVLDFWTVPDKSKFTNCECLHGSILDYPFNSRKWDLVTCMQVLEHIREVKLAAKRLFSISQKYVIITLPYMWPVGKEPDHIQDPVTEEKLEDWFADITGFHEISRVYCDNNSRVLLMFERKG